MHEQPVTVDQHPFRPMATAEGPPDPGSDGVHPVAGPVSAGEGPAAGGDRSDVAPAASLVGSLSVFSLADVLSLLATTAQTGELQVVTDTSGGRLWLDRGQLSNAQVGLATTIGQSVFELACLSEGWFYFTSGTASSSGQPSVSVDAVLSEVRPQVDEWKEIRSVVPLDALVSLSPTPPGHDVQIRSDQWQVLTTVGSSGRSVNDVLDEIGGDQVTGLRTLRDLNAAGLVVLTPTSQRSISDPGATSLPPISIGQGPALPASSSAPGDAPDVGTVPPPPGAEPVVVGSAERAGNLAEVAIMPPPIAGDPWAPIGDRGDSKDDGAA